MNKRGENEGFRVLDDFVCEAIRNPAVPQAPASQRGQNEGVRVLEDFSVEFTERPRETDHNSQPLRQPAEVRSQRDTLLCQLRAKFTTVPEEVARRVEATDDVEQLKSWLHALIQAQQLADVGIAPLESGE
jgi:hypothetical protein